MDKISFMDNIKMANRWVFQKKALLEFPYSSYVSIREFQLKQIRQLLSDAIQFVPYYRHWYSKLHIYPDDIKSFLDFEKIPTISKGDLVGNELAFIDERYKGKRLIKSKTSGTSGVFADIYCDPDMFVIEELQVIRMIKELYPNFNPLSKEVLVYTSEYPVSSILGFYRAYYVNNLHSARYILDFIRNVKPSVLAIYPSILREIVNTFDDIDFADLRLKLILTNSEQSLQSERNYWAGIFKCQVIDEFSSEEVQSIAYQCEHMSYHEVSDCSYIELLHSNNDKSVALGEVGEITGTCFINRAMPLIRYRQGDFAMRDTNHCICGKCTPVIGVPMGRINSSFVTANGEIIPSGRLLDWSYSLVLNKNYSIREFQIVQETCEDVNIFLVSPFLTDLDLRFIEHDFIYTFGNVFHVRASKVNMIKRTSSGKHIPIYSKISPSLQRN